MTWKIELGTLAIVAMAVGGYIHQSGDPLVEAPSERVATFTQNDYAAFDRSFDLGDQPCTVGLKASKICLTPSPMEDEIVRGEPLPAALPAMSANMRVLLALELKEDGLKTVQYGQTLALIEPETRRVRDVLRLDASSYVKARGLGGGSAVVTSAK